MFYSWWPTQSIFTLVVTLVVSVASRANDSAQVIDLASFAAPFKSEVTKIHLGAEIEFKFVFLPTDVTLEQVKARCHELGLISFENKLEGGLVVRSKYPTPSSDRVLVLRRQSEQGWALTEIELKGLVAKLVAISQSTPALYLDDGELSLEPQVTYEMGNRVLTLRCAATSLSAEKIEADIQRAFKAKGYLLMGNSSKDSPESKFYLESFEKSDPFKLVSLATGELLRLSKPGENSATSLVRGHLIKMDSHLMYTIDSPIHSKDKGVCFYENRARN